MPLGLSTAFLVKAARADAAPSRAWRGADCWLLLQPMGSASHSKVSEILPRPERMWRAPPCVGWLHGIPADPPSPSGCAMESRQDHILPA